MHHGNRAAPVTLPRQAPVAQAILRDTAPDALPLAEGDRGVYRLVARRDIGPTVGPGPAHLVRRRRHIGGAGLFWKRMVSVQRHEGRSHRQVVFPGEIKVALVMCRAAEDRAGAIVHQDEIRDPDRKLPRRVERVAHAQPGVEAQLVGIFDGLLGRATAPRLRAKRRDSRVVPLQRLRKRVVGRDADEGRTHQRVGPRRVDLDPVVAMRLFGQAEGELKAPRPADPVGLHQLDLGGPVVEPVQRVQQFAREIRDAEEPLRQLAPLHIRARPPALAVDDLLVGQHGHVDRVPVNHSVLAVHEALFQEIEEQRLLLAVVFRVAGREFAGPVDRQAQRLHLPAHRRDVLIGPVGGVAALFHRGVLGGHPEGVPAHRMQHAVSKRAPVPRHHVAHRIVANMPHVDASRRIGKHLQHIVFRLGRVAAGGKHPGLVPGALPFLFGGGGVVPRHRASPDRASGGVIPDRAGASSAGTRPLGHASPRPPSPGPSSRCQRPPARTRSCRARVRIASSTARCTSADAGPLRVTSATFSDRASSAGSVTCTVAR